MGVYRSVLAASLAAAMLAGCHGMQIQEAKKASPTGTEFSTSLYGEYVKLSEFEYGQGDYRDSDVHADAAIKAAANSPTEPVPIASRNLPGDKVDELSSARGRLTDALSAGAREKMPEKAAHAQAMFDCWMEQQEENFQPTHIAACRDGLMASLDEVEAGLRPPPVAAAPEPTPAEPVEKRFAVYFPFDSANLTPQSASVVEEAIDAAKQLDGAKITLVGNADTMGPERYNLGLSERRVTTIVDEIKQSGLATTDVALTSLGETNLPVPTPDNVAEQGNRRVEIVVTK